MTQQIISIGSSTLLSSRPGIRRALCKWAETTRRGQYLLSLLHEAYLAGLLPVSVFPLLGWSSWYEYDVLARYHRSALHEFIRTSHQHCQEVVLEHMVGLGVLDHTNPGRDPVAPKLQ